MRGSGRSGWARHDRGQAQCRSGGVTQLDARALGDQRLASDRSVDEHAVAPLAAHRPARWGGGDQQVCPRHEGMDDLHIGECGWLAYGYAEDPYF